ncbi:MAG: leucine-rich repeat domain-containing protein [Spirochaetaceae bacterium]|nr:leucine-rich repeat domain-containing protein [Spirochaetaceae bacterium]
MRKPLLRALCTAVLAFAAGAGIHAQTTSEGLRYTKSGQAITITDYSGTARTVVIPAAIEGLPVTAIGDYAFQGCGGLTSITIPGSVTAIGNYAFAWCSGLTGITIPNSVTSIGYGAFWGCGSLTGITIPNSVTAIGNGAFERCGSLASVTIPNSVTAIGEAAFRGCGSLESITVDKNNTAYTGIDGVLFTKNQKTLAAYPGGKKGAYTIPASVTAIGNGAFYAGSRLESANLPNSITEISYAAFSECAGLRSVTIPASVTKIETMAFEACTSLTSVTFAAGSGIREANFSSYNAFPGDLRAKYAAGTSGAGRYTRPHGSSDTWTKGSIGSAAEPLFTGTGGAGKSIAILVSKYKEAGVDLPTVLPEVVQSALITDFKKYSAIEVLDRETLDRLLQETIDPTYEDSLDIVRLGHVTHTDYIMTGSILKTRTGYVMSLHIANTRDGRINASVSVPCTLDELENLTGIHKAAADLLPQLGVSLTGKAKQELAAPPAGQPPAVP